jgi:hypothetical protein
MPTTSQDSSEIRQAKSLARFWRTHNPGRPGGVVIIDDETGSVAGWMSTLRDPQNWCPGCIAVGVNGTCWLAYGGNAQDGARDWLLISVEAAA